MKGHGEQFKQYVDGIGMNKTKLAADLGVTKQSLYQMFKTRSFNPDTIKRIEGVLNTDWQTIQNSKVNTDSKAIVSTTQPRTSSDTVDYRDEYIALLKQQLHEKTRRLDVLEKKITEYINSDKVEAYLQSVLALGRTQLDVTLQAQARSEKKDLKKLKESASTLFDEHLAVIESAGK